MMDSIQLGAWAEQAALSYLRTQGLSLVAPNYRSRYGEIDLIMKDGEQLVFIEIRYRGREDFGDAISSITYGKQRKIIRTALFYLQKHKLIDKICCRFDVIGLSPNVKSSEIEWIKDAFRA